MKRILLILALCLLPGCAAVPTAPPDSAQAPVQAQPSPTPRPLPPTWTPEPTRTPQPTRTPGPTSTPSPQRETRGVIVGVFREYRSAILDGEVEAVRPLVSEPSVAWYGQMRDHALVLTGPELEALPFVQKLMILRLRHTLPAEELARLDAESIFALAVQEGWIGRESVEGLEIGRVDVEEEQAWAYTVQSDGAFPVLHFVKEEEGGWKVDLVTSLEIQEAAFQKLLELQGADAADTLTYLISSASDREVDERIFEGPLYAADFPSDP